MSDMKKIFTFILSMKIEQVKAEKLETEK